ncbi:Ger(x)C family spore germination protein [Brevibacillus humidisoli]|uniref:Ger(x)C family spore germination protein n=1 Tax=Brevibacillus humidisoli TaxID=2895522 RepID=UPI001E310EC6|nr:Ger(x)C family spore germination protein [Brevibacillus humidisoli]UFJ42623.1 Ger(x)C family spore germination protein [Brevibacillus humidisoli]
MSKMLQVLCLLLPVALGGCWDAKELDRVYYVHAIGVEYNHGRFEVYAQILNFASLAKQDIAGQSAEQTAWVGKGVGKTLDTAIHDLYATSQEEIYWGHLTAIVLHESTLEQGLKQVLDIFTRFHETRYTIWMFATRSSVQEILSASPILNESPVFSQLGNPEDIYDQRSFIEPIRMHRFIADLQEPGKTSLLPYLTVAKEKWYTRDKAMSVLKMEGISILRDGRLVGWLPSEKIPGLRWMTRATNRASLVATERSEPVAVILLGDARPAIIPTVKGDTIYFSLSVEVTGEIIQLMRNASEKEVTRLSEQAIKREIESTFAKGVEIGADLYQVTHSLYRKKTAEWKRLDSRGHFPLRKDSLRTVKVKADIYSARKTKLEEFKIESD